jgi:hypothetical protein
MQPTSCLNCEAVLLPEQKFCGQCGQTAHLHRLNMHYVLHEGAHFVTHTDKSIFSLLLKLAHQPGYIARSFIEGKRKRYLSPLNFYLIIIGMFVFVLSSLKTFERPATFSQTREDVRQIKDPVKRDRRLAKLERSEEVTKFMGKYSNLVSMLGATPLTAFLFSIFYRKSRYNFTEHLVANFYFSGFTAFIFILLVAPLTYIFQNITVYLSIIGAFLLFELIYKSIAYYQFMNRKGTRHYLYALLIATIAIITWVLLSQGAINIYIETGFNFL